MYLCTQSTGQSLERKIKKTTMIELPRQKFSTTSNMFKIQTESVKSREEAYCDGEPDKVNPCFIIYI